MSNVAKILQSNEFDENYVKSIIIKFREHIDKIDVEFLENNITVKVIEHTKDESDWGTRWYYTYFRASLSDNADYLYKENPYLIYVIDTNVLDSYTINLLEEFKYEWVYDSFDRNAKPHNDEEEKVKMSELLTIWRKAIRETYSRSSHIKRLIWSLKSPYNKRYWDKIDKLAKSIFVSEQINYSDINAIGLSLELLDYKIPIDHVFKPCVKIKSIHGILEKFTGYEGNHNILPNEESINIPSSIWVADLGVSLGVAEIAKGIFKALSNAKHISLPYTLKKSPIDFWRCRNLERISVKIPSGYGEYLFRDIDGVLYNNELTELIAYPNMHGKIYEVPEGVKVIKGNAFKACESVEVVVLPSTLELIEEDAFQCCYHLRLIIMKQLKTKIECHGIFGHSKEISPEWYWLSE